MRNQLAAAKENAGMVVRVIDIETTGTDPQTDAIVEIGAVDVLADGSITNQQSTLVRPASPCHPRLPPSTTTPPGRGPAIITAGVAHVTIDATPPKYGRSG
jgi:DNA polymerase III epsilon subunit-like protein